MQEYVENCISENSALRRKLQSKTEALLILSKELDKCRTERDQFKLMAEQLQDRYSNLKRKTQDMGMCCASLYLDEGKDSLRPGVTVAQLLGETREQNKALRIQLEDLKQRLNDAYGDIKVLRAGNAQHRLGNTAPVGGTKIFPDHHKEELVQQLETLNSKCSQLQADVQAILDEKEDLVRERDVYKCKVHRLNHELCSVMKAGKDNIDVDSLVMENRYLQERLQQCQDEHEATRRSLQKYKGALDQKRPKKTVHLGMPAATAGLVVSQKQVKELLDTATHPLTPNTPATVENLRSVCQALFDGLEEKSIRLAHQKKANQILAKRVVELESMAGSSGASLFPSQILLDGYSGSEVDRGSEQTTDIMETPEKDVIPPSCAPQAITKDKTKYTGIDFHSSLRSSSDVDDCQPLPPNVQALVQQALEELQLEANDSKILINEEECCEETGIEHLSPAKSCHEATLQNNL